MGPNQPNYQAQAPQPGAQPQAAPGYPQAPQQAPPQGYPQQPQQPMPPQGYPQQAPPQGYPQQPPPGYRPGMPPPGMKPQRPPAPPRQNPNSAQNSLLIAEIRDGIVIMNDGTFRAVVLTKSINFDLMSPQEREAVEGGYQGFLNSLYFPIQIYIRSRKIDIRPYMDRLQKLRNEQDNMLLALLMDDYIRYITVLAQESNIMDKQFYIVIPYTPGGEEELSIGARGTVKSGQGLLKGIFGKKQTQMVTINEQTLEEAKSELKNRVQATVNSLQQMSLQAIPLDTQELIELYYDSYNPDTATLQQIQNISDLEAMVVTQGEGDAINPNLDRV